MSKFKLELDKKLFYLKNKSAEWVEVDLKPCFPQTFADQYYSLQDDKGEEIELIERIEKSDFLDELDIEILNEYINFKKFTFVIIGIYSIAEDFGLRNFKVKTVQGDRSFQTGLDVWPRVINNGAILIDDLYGEQYWIHDLEFGQDELNALV